VEQNNIPFIVQGQINKTINEQNVQQINTNTQNENVKDLSFSNAGDSKIKIRPESPKISYKLIIADKSKIGINITAIPSLFDDIGSSRQIVDDTYSIIKDGKIIKEGIKPSLDFTDIDVKYGSSYSYIIRVFSPDGVSNDSAQISISVTDSTIPHIPYSFEVLADGPADIQNGRATIRFRQNNDADYYGMRILIKQSDLPETDWKEAKFVPKVETESLLDGSYVRASISGLIFGKYYDFAIQAKDFFDNLSDMTVITNKRLEDNVSPNYPLGFTAVNSSTDAVSSCNIKWETPLQKDGILDVAGYKLDRYLSNDPMTSTTIATINDPTVLFYNDSSVSAGSKYVYKIRAFDSSANYSDYAYSNEVLVSLNASTVEMAVSHDISGENTFPITVSVSSSISADGFYINLKQISTGKAIIYGKRYTGNAPFSTKIEYKDLSLWFLNSVNSQAFLDNDFKVELYKLTGLDKYDLLSSQVIDIDFTPPTVNNFDIAYDAKIKKITFTWDKQTFSLTEGYEIRYAGKALPALSWDSSSIFLYTDKDNNSISSDIPTDIDLTDPETTAYFHIKAKSRINRDNFIPPQSFPAMYCKSEISSSELIYGKLPAVTGMVVTGDVQSVVIKFTPLDLSVYKGVKEYWIYGSYTQSDLTSPTEAMIVWKGQASMPVINRIAGDIIPNEIRTIYFKIVAVDFDGGLGALSELFSGEAHDNTTPDYTVSFNPNILVDRLLISDSLTVTLSAYDNSGFLVTGALYSSIDDADFVSKTYSLTNENKNLSYQEVLSGLSTGQHKILFKIYDKYNNFTTTQVYNFEVDASIPEALPAPYILKDNSFVQSMQIALSGRTYLPLTNLNETIDIFNSKTVQVCLPSFTTCTNFSHIKLYVAEYNISTSSYGSYVEIKMPQSASLPSSTIITDFKATVTFVEDMPDFKIKAIQVKKNGIVGDIAFAVVSTKNKIDTTPPLIKLNSIRYENDTSLENIANLNFINSRIINGGLIFDLTIIETNSGLWSNAVDVTSLRMPVYYQINGGANQPLLEYGSPMFKSPFYIPKEQFSSFEEGEKVTINIYALDNALKIGNLKITKIMNKWPPSNIANEKAVFGIEANKPVIKISYSKPANADLIGIRLYENGVLLKETLGEVMSIPTLETGLDRTFVLKSLDEAYNESTGVTLVAHNYAPAQVTNFSIQQDINGLVLTWSPVTKDTNDNDMTDLKYYELTYTKYNGTVVEKSLTNRFTLILTKDEVAYYNANPSVNITGIKVRAMDFYNLYGAYSTELYGRPRFIEAVDMTDNVFQFVATSNRFSGTFSYILDGNFKNSEYVSSSVSKDDYIQIDMLKPDYISDVKVKFSSSSDVIRFILGYYYVSTGGTKEWRYLSAGDSSHSVNTIVSRGSDIETAHSNYIEVAVPDGTDAGGTYLISMLKSALSKQVLYCSSVKLIFSSSLSSVAVSEIQPRLRSIYNEFYGEVLYLSTMASIRSSEDATNFLNFDKEKLSLYAGSDIKVKLGLLADSSYGLWAKDNILLGGDEISANMKIDTTSVNIGFVSTGLYQSSITSTSVKLGYKDATHSSIEIGLNEINLWYSTDIGHLMKMDADGIYMRGRTSYYDLSITYNKIGLGYKSPSIYNLELTSIGIGLGYNATTTKHNTMITDSKISLGSIDSSDHYNTEISSSSIKLGYYSGTIYDFELDATSIRFGYNGVASKHNVIIEDTGMKIGPTTTTYYNTEISGSKISMGHLGSGLYSMTMDYSDGINFLSIRGPETNNPEFFRLGRFPLSVGYLNTMWVKSIYISSDGYSGIVSDPLSAAYIIASSDKNYSLIVNSGQAIAGAMSVQANGSVTGMSCNSYNGLGISCITSGSSIAAYIKASYEDAVYALTNATGYSAVHGVNNAGSPDDYSYGVAAYSSGNYSLYSSKGSKLDGNVVFGAQLYAPSMDSDAGTYAVKWTSVTGKFTKDTSSLRYKHDIERLSFDVNLYNEIKPSKFKYNSNNSNDVGFIAEEMITLFPDLVILDKNNRPDAIKYDRISVYNVLANQYNNSRIKELESKIAELKELVNSLIK